MVLSHFILRAAAVGLVAVSGLVAPFAKAAVLLQVNGAGILTGASGITVGALPGTYSVQFVDGTCASVFGACAPANFTFHTLADSTAASTALLAQVLVDSALGNFDTSPGLTAGCGDIRLCLVLTPFATSAVGVFDRDAAINSAVEASDKLDSTLGGTSSGTLFDTAQDDRYAFAVWSLDSTPAAIPEPGSLALVGLAGLALSWAQRRRRPAAPTT